MYISKHLSLQELTRSDVAKRLGISNMPTEEHIYNLKILAEAIFEPIRNHFNSPIYISSGYRSAELNKAIKGSKTSQHLKGEAIDIDMDGSTAGITNVDVFNYIKDHLPFDQLIYEFGNKSNPDWVHVSYKANGKQRKQVLKSVRFGGTIQYIPYI